MDCWYVAHTHPHAEHRALEHLRRQGFSVYLPRYRKLRRHARRVETVRAPLFPGYLFISMDIARTRWRAIRSTLGVRNLVCEGERPVPVPPGVVEEIQAREDAEGDVPVEDNRFRAGEEVRVSDGPLTGQIGWFQRALERDRIMILLELLGRRVPLTVPLAAVRSAW
jgi:transcriptional antiterminator RfaH